MALIHWWRENKRKMKRIEITGRIGVEGGWEIDGGCLEEVAIEQTVEG